MPAAACGTPIRRAFIHALTMFDAGSR
jgi:hypothetical protein